MFAVTLLNQRNFLFKHVRNFANRPPRPSLKLNIPRGSIFDKNAVLIQTTKVPIPESAVLSLIYPARSSMISWLTFITLPTADTETSLLLHFDDKAYVFGRLAENFQRAATQRGARLSKVHDFFVTGASKWSSTGGLLGFALTRADQMASKKKQIQENGRNNVNVKEVMRIHGPPNLLHTIATARRFIFRTGGEVYIDEYTDTEASSTPEFSDSNIQVWPIRVRKSPPSKKRSLDDIEPKTKETVQEIVNAMFFSENARDTLFQVALKDVKPPVQKVWVRDLETKALREYTGPLPGPGTTLPNPDLLVLVRRPWPNADVVDLPPMIQTETSMSYIVSTYPTRGKFLAQKAKQLGVKPGPNCRLLTEGKSVTLDDGTIITPDQVVEDAKAPFVFAVCDIPTEDYVQDFFSKKEFQSDGMISKIDMFIWILGPSITNDSTWRQFVEKHDKKQHYISSSDYCPNLHSATSSAAYSSTLAKEMPFAFKRPIAQKSIIPNSDVKRLPSSVQIANRDDEIRIKPHVELRKSDLSGYTPFFISDQRRTLIKDTEKDIQEQAPSISEWQSTINGLNSEIIPLGTGSAMPSTHRNVSAMLIKTPEDNGYLFDCGESTIGQMARLFQPEELNRVLKGLRMIWISHLHADHLLGVVGLLKAWYKARHNGIRGPYAESMSNDRGLVQEALKNCEDGSAPLAIVCTEDMARFLFEYSRIEDIGVTQCIVCDAFPALINAENGTIAKKSMLEIFPTKEVIPVSAYNDLLGITDINTCFVRHCKDSKAISVTISTASEGNMKISYSGDCRPSLAFSVIGKNSDVLIHESTFGDDMLIEATAKRHCTVGEALMVGEAMEAKSVVLTHFSQRYAKTSNLYLDSEKVATPITPSLDLGQQTHKAFQRLKRWEKKPGSEISPQDLTSRITREICSRMKVVLAFDFMRIKLKDLAKMQFYTEFLSIMASIELDEEDVKEEDEDDKKKNEKKKKKTTKKGERK